MMRHQFNHQQYFDLCQQLAEERYDVFDDVVEDVGEIEWMPVEPEAKIKMEKYRDNSGSGMIDLTGVKSSQIKERLFRGTFFRVGAFKVRITRYNAVPSKNGSQLTADVSIWEEKHQTPSGFPCKMDYPMCPDRDDRFSEKAWAKKYWNGTSSAHNMPIDAVVEVIKWLGAVKKIGAFF